MTEVPIGFLMETKRLKSGKTVEKRINSPLSRMEYWINGRLRMTQNLKTREWRNHGQSNR